MTRTAAIIRGSGLAGGYIASARLDGPDVSVALGTRHQACSTQAEAKLASQRGNERVSTVVVDAADEKSTKRAEKRGCR
jgi:hypothetical protein